VGQCLSTCIVLDIVHREKREIVVLNQN